MSGTISSLEHPWCSLKGAKEVTPTGSKTDLTCEKALIAVLPFFEYLAGKWMESNTIDSVALNDNGSRKFQSFCVSFQLEACLLRANLEDIVEQWEDSTKINSDEYRDTISSILTLFEDQISYTFPGVTQECLSFEDHDFYKLCALTQLDSIGDKYSYSKLHDLIRIPPKQKKRDDFLSKIETYNKTLKSLIEGPGVPFFEGRQPVLSNYTPRYAVRGALKQLYQVLAKTWKTNCSDHPHRAKLRLASFCQDRSTKSNSGEEFKQNVDMLFATLPPQLRWRQSRIQICYKEISRSSTHWEKVPAASDAAPHPLKKRRPRLIECICTAINDADIRKSCLHVRTEGDHMWKLPHGTGTPKYLLTSDEVPTISLKTLIESSRPQFTLMERRILAVILAHSLLHLSESSWLDKELTKGDLCFLLKTPRTADIRKPFLSVLFGDKGVESDIWDSSHPAKSLLGLGIVLIELEYGPIEKMWEEGDKIDGEQYSDTNRIAAQRCLEDSRLWDINPYPAFRQAVSACINGTFLNEFFEDDDDGNKPQDDHTVAFQMAIYNNVVKYLEQELFTINEKVAGDILKDTDFDACLEYPLAETSMSLMVQGHSMKPQFSAQVINYPLMCATQFTQNGTEGKLEKTSDSVFDSEVFSTPESSEIATRIKLAADFFSRLAEVQSLLDTGRTDDFIPVKVAIIDTGIHEHYCKPNNVVGYFDFVDPDFAEGSTAACDKTGHGSDMVYLLHKTAPYVEIYVARVLSSNRGDTNTAMLAAKAIEYARDKWHVDIISMSFGFQKIEPKLEKAIQDTENILMFAAASNFGALEYPPIRFPARFLDKVISINAADGNGHPSNFNPPPDKMNTKRNFSILGEAIALPQGSQAGTEKQEPRYGSGTSMATPIAAGIAALVIEFALQGSRHTKVQDKNHLWTQTGMLSVFRKMSKGGTKGGFNFIAPWKVLQGEAEFHSLQMEEVCQRITDAIKSKFD